MYLLSNTHADQDRPTGQEEKKEHKTWQGCLAKAHSGMKEDIGATNTLRRRREGKGCQGGTGQGTEAREGVVVSFPRSCSPFKLHLANRRMIAQHRNNFTQRQRPSANSPS
jgi:hypothetical protein